MEQEIDCKMPSNRKMRTEDNQMSVYVIAQSKIENRALLDQYVAKVIPTIESHQGRVVAFDEEPEVVEGPIEQPHRHSRIPINDGVPRVV